MDLIDYKNKIYEAIKSLNENPSFNTLGKVEAMINTYSDSYKDEYYHRPSCAEFRAAYSKEALKLLEAFNDLLFTEALEYLGYQRR